MLAGGVVFLVVFVITRRVSVGSLAMAASWALGIWIFLGSSLEITTGAALCLIIVFSHRANLRRLFRGEEKKFEFHSESTK